MKKKNDTLDLLLEGSSITKQEVNDSVKKRLAEIKKMKECTHDYSNNRLQCKICQYDVTKEIVLSEQERELQKTCKHKYVTYRYKRKSDLKIHLLTRCSKCYYRKKEKNVIFKLLSKLFSKKL